jgi:inorganic phosphate transporter, PiT family
MNQVVFPQSQEGRSPGQRYALLIFLLVIAAGIVYCVMHLLEDLAPVRESSIFPYVMLGVALLIALGFEFVNGFHDTANAVATVIYTHSLTPNLAVVWSGMWN